MNIIEKEIVEEKSLIELFNCTCPTCGTPSVGITDADGIIKFDCWNCTLQSLYGNV